ncbi:MAG TPA: DUF6160 family protein [Candidatus Macondimonas sp.]|nr:DUF6160 family protein [Candidatus Macondimonas sp.]
MKHKFISIAGLLALAPLAAQAELVAMQDSELANVSGQAFTFDFNLTLDKTIAGLDVYKNVYGYKLSATDWELGQDSEISNPISGRYFGRTQFVGNDGGMKYSYSYKYWGRDI